MEAYKRSCHIVWVAGSGNVTDEVRAEYIKNQTPPEAGYCSNVK